MFSTARLLQTGKFITNCSVKGVKGYHIQVVSHGKGVNRWGLLLRKNHPVASLGAVSLARFESTDAKVIEAIVDPIPEPPIPPPPISSSVEQISQWMQQLDKQVFDDGNCHRTIEDLPGNMSTTFYESPISGGEKVENRSSVETDELLEMLGVTKVTSEVSDNLPQIKTELLDSEMADSSQIPMSDISEQVEPEVLHVFQGNEDLPEPPIPIEQHLQENIELLGEPTFQSVGLGGWSPVGMVQQCMEFLHITCDLPWWGSIVIGTIVVRVLMFPLVIASQRNSAKMNNLLPEMQLIQLKMSDARERGDRLDAARYSQEMMEFMKEKGLNPFKNMMVPLAQAPLFISFFMGLRGMANLPVESLRDGGLYWFTDLTVPDEFYLLPIITSATLAVTIEVGTDTARLNSANMGMMKYFLRGMPLIIFPFTVNFPAAILLYWTSSNFISLIQVSILRIPRVRDYFGIEKLVRHKPSDLPIPNKGFIKGAKESWTNMKITRELEERERVDEMNFMQAGRGAVKKTYKYDPTQPRAPNISVNAKKRD